MTRQSLAPKTIQILFILSILCSSSLYAFSFKCRDCHPLIALSAGSATANVKGKSKFSVGESSYNYHPRSHSTTQFFAGVAIGTEYLLHPCWSMQLLLDYSQPKGFNGRGRVVQGVDIETSDGYFYQYQIISRVLLLEGKLLANLFDCFHPYVLAGLGAAANTAYNYSVTIVPPWTTISPIFSQHTTTSFAYALGVGVDFDLDPGKCWRIGAGYRYNDLGQTKLGDAILNTTKVAHSLSQSSFSLNEFFVQLTYIAF